MIDYMKQAEALLVTAGQTQGPSAVANVVGVAQVFALLEIGHQLRQLNEWIELIKGDVNYLTSIVDIVGKMDR